MNEDFQFSGHFNQNVNNSNNYQFYPQNGLVPLNGGQSEHSGWNCGFEEIMKYFGFYARKFVRFSQNIPGNILRYFKDIGHILNFNQV